MTLFACFLFREKLCSRKSLPRPYVRLSKSARCHPDITGSVQGCYEGPLVKGLPEERLIFQGT